MSEREQAKPGPRPGLGVVVIGRNEGELVLRALGSVDGRAEATVYADSASTDGSVARVRQAFPDVHVVEIDPSRPMTPARGRNEGMARLLAELPGVRFIQLLDGDCDLAPGWLDRATAYLAEHPDVGIVCGRLRERDRERNSYHRLADMEWDQPPGEIFDAGGIMLIRREVWEDVGGQNADIPAAEEREFLRRARARGWRAMRLPEDMARHDIDMAALSEWWARMRRMGHSWAQGLWIYRDQMHLRQVLSVALWGGAVPVAALAAALPTLGASVPLAALAYRRQWRRIAAERQGRGDSREDAALYATAMLAGKAAGTLGVADFLLRTLPAGRGGRRR